MSEMFRLDIEYDGTDFVGWQRQREGRAIQNVVEDGLGQVFGQETLVAGAGRTDAGVHALAQCARFSCEKGIPLKGLVLRLNEVLPADVNVTRAWRVTEDFHPRYSALGKTYGYRIHRSPTRSALLDRYVWQIAWAEGLDLEGMVAASQILCGQHDFRSFSVGTDEDACTMREIFECEVFTEGNDTTGELLVRVKGSGFLNKMVRMIVGTLVEVGRGRLSTQDVVGFLKRPVVGTAGPTAPARGLSLLHVDYPPPWDRGDEDLCWPVARPRAVWPHPEG